RIPWLPSGISLGVFGDFPRTRPGENPRCRLGFSLGTAWGSPQVRPPSRARHTPLGGRPVIKAIGTAYRRDDFTPQAFMQYWLDVHAPLSAKAPGLRGYVVSEVVRKLRGDLEAEAFVEQWFDDEAAFEAAGRSPELATAWADVGNYAKLSGSFWLVK